MKIRQEITKIWKFKALCQIYKPSVIIKCKVKMMEVGLQTKSLKKGKEIPTYWPSLIFWMKPEMHKILFFSLVEKVLQYHDC